MKSFIALASLLFMASAVRAEEAKPVEELQGTWKLTGIEVEEQSRDFLGGTARWVIKGHKITYAGEEMARFTTDPKTSPRIIDIKFKNPERSYEGIYEVEKDKLKICLNKVTEAKDRPSKFSTKDQTNWRLLVFEKEKAPPANVFEGLTPFVGMMLMADEDKKLPLVTLPIPGSAAEKAGIKKGDIVLQVGKTKVTEVQETVDAVRATKAGEKLDIVVKRDDKEKTITVTVGVMPFYIALGLE